MALSEYQKQLLKELVGFVKSWTSDDPEYNGLIRDKYLVEFVSDLQAKIYDEISMSGKSGQTLLLYTGQSVETGKWIWQEMGEFCTKNSKDYYYISNTDAGSILWEPQFQEAVITVIGDDDISTQVLSGKYWDGESNTVGARKGPYAIDGTTLLSLDDFISSTLTKKAIENGNRVIYVAGQGWNSDSVGMQSEIPTFIKEAWIGKNIDEALNTRLTIVSDLSEITDIDSQYISDVDLYKTEFYVDADGKVTGVKLVSGLDDINVGTVSTNGTMLTYGSGLGILGDEAIIGKYNLFEEFTQPDIDMYRRFDYYTSVGVSDKGIRKIGILSDADIKFKYEFLSECTDTDILNQFRNYEYIMTNEIAKTTADKMSATNIYLNSEGKIVSMSDVSMGEIPAESVYKITMNDAKNFLLDETMESTYQDYKSLSSLEKIQAKQFDYEKRLISDMVDKGITSEKGIELLPTDELKTKYSFIDDATDANVIKELQLAEYRNSKYGTGVADSVTLYFDDAGKVVAASNQTYRTSIESNVKYTTAIEDYLNASKNFLLDETMESMYPGYKDLSPLEKIQAKQLDYDYRQVTLKLDKITISDATMNKYLSGSQKTADQLNAVDRQLMKLADIIGNKISGKDDTLKSITRLADSCKGIGKAVKTIMPVVDVIGTVGVAVVSISQAVELYKAGYESEASAVMTGCAINVAGGIAGGTALTSTISPYLIGLGAAVGGPVGASFGAIISGVIGYGLAGLAASEVGQFVTESWDDIVTTLENIYHGVTEGIDDLYGGVLAAFDPDADGAYFGGSDKGDYITGGDGDNKIEGFAGNDYLRGGDGNDAYINSAGGGTDVIEDNSGTNTIKFTDSTVNKIFNNSEQYCSVKVA